MKILAPFNVSINFPIVKEKKKREIEARVMQGLKKEERINVYIGI